MMGKHISWTISNLSNPPVEMLLFVMEGDAVMFWLELVISEAFIELKIAVIGLWFDYRGQCLKTGLAERAQTKVSARFHSSCVGLIYGLPVIETGEALTHI